MSEHSVIDHLLWMFPGLLWLVVSGMACWGAVELISRHINRHIKADSDVNPELTRTDPNKSELTENGIERHWRTRKEGWM